MLMEVVGGGLLPAVHLDAGTHPLARQVPPIRRQRAAMARPEELGIKGRAGQASATAVTTRRPKAVSIGRGPQPKIIRRAGACGELWLDAGPSRPNAPRVWCPSSRPTGGRCQTAAPPGVVLPAYRNGTATPPSL